ncbi:MAG: hypothetical protein IJT97_11160 [Bacteroidaceae bacterium]|nr:hypothetical protein [Bacteroidaceae bacterium]
MIRKYSFHCFFISCICILFAACQGKQAKSSESQKSDSDEFIEEDVFYNDTIEDKKVSQDCAAIAYNLDGIITQLEGVLSPSMLMKAKYDYLHQLPQVTSEVNQLPADEKAVMQKKMNRIRTLYNETCKTYEVEASGIISNLQNLINQIHKVNSKAAFDNYCSGRYGILNNLDIIHLSTHDNSPHINEIKRLAKELNSLLQAKKAEFGDERKRS